MKNSPNNLLLATAALFLGTVIGSFGPFFTKIILRELPPMTVLFLRISIMVVILLPLVIRKQKFLFTHLRQLIILGLFWIGNLAFFVNGIQTATALSAALLYACVPIMVLVVNRLTHVEQLTKSKIASVVLGFVGVGIILFSNNHATSLGSFFGTLLLFFATISYSSFLLYSKHLSIKLTPLELTGSSAVVGWFIALLIMIVFDGVSGIGQLPFISLAGWVALLYSGVMLGVFMYFLVNWGVRHGSTLIAGSMQYVGMVMTGLTGIFLLGEQMTVSFLLGAICVMAGLWLITIFPSFHKR